MAASNGNCFICGKTAGKVTIKNHVLKEHKSGDERCYIFRAEGVYDKDYWLLFTVAFDATMAAVDNFLREIWCECCGHLSQFRMGGGVFGKSRKISALPIGATLLYEYDFGSTTEILITVIDEIYRPKQHEKVQLLARNVPPEYKCWQCNAPATAVNAWEGDMLCDECAGNAEDEEAVMPLVNSPRCGVCGYDGELDIWTFDAEKPFPQPQMLKAKYCRDKTVEEAPPEDRWNKIPHKLQTKILNNVYCVKCKLTSVKEYTIENAQNDIIISGKCTKCGGNVARVVEMD
ncbi:MAG: plasmid pRiA4b ORF-3 family protein [Firmicutes bacterium]|nr:plasmid pRiA4b ORF-3 family protein [Bacillota bacterium]